MAGGLLKRSETVENDMLGSAEVGDGGVETETEGAADDRSVGAEDTHRVDVTGPIRPRSLRSVVADHCRHPDMATREKDRTLLAVIGDEVSTHLIPSSIAMLKSSAGHRHRDVARRHWAGRPTPEAEFPRRRFQ